MKKYARMAGLVLNIRSITQRVRKTRFFPNKRALLFSVIACVIGASPHSSLASQAEIDAMSAAAKNLYLPVGTSLDGEVSNTILPLLSGGGNTFTDINYGGGNGWDQVQHLERAKKMAQAYQDPASAHYQDAALHDTILALVDYFMNNWPHEPSWWWAAIGYPNNCNPVVMLMKDEIIGSSAYPNLQSQTDSKLTSKSWNTRGNSGGGANDSDICTSALVAALLSNDYGYCTSIKNYCNPLFSVKTGYNDGLMSDSSFTQHSHNGRQFQLTSYGREYMGGFLELATIFKPSSLKFSDEVIGSFEDLYLSGVRHLIYHANGPGTHWQDPGYMDILQAGRGYPSGGWIDRGLAEFNMSYNIPEFIAYGAPRSEELQELQDILTDVVQETVPANKMFWHQDMMTHQRPHYYTSARGTSTRTVGNEGRISEAAKSYHMGDGVNMVLHHGDEYDGIYAPWDWKRLPGTTIEQNGSALPANSTLLQWPGGQAHAGGVSDGTYGNYGFYFNEGGNNSKMEAYKSQFFFDDEYVCLGAGIDASGAGSDVVTTINQTMHKTDFVVQGTTYSSGSAPLNNNQWVQHYDIGYLILDKDGTATASVDSQTGNKSDINGGTSYSPDSVTANIFNLTINHGSGSYTGKKYAYVVVPGLTATEMNTYATAPAVEVLSNSTTVQAVHHAGLRLTSAHFYSAGSLTMKDGTILTTDKAVALLLKEEGSYLVISAADPKYQGTTTTITLNKELSGTGVSWNGSISTIPITLAGGGHDNGKSVSIAVVDESTGGPLDAELLNGSFQSGDTAGWDVTWNGQNLKKSMHAFDGSYALSIQHGAALHQFVKVQPNTQYALNYAIKTTDGTEMVIGVNDSADSQLKAVTESDGTYQSKRVTFTTGAADTTVKVWLWHPGNQGSDAVAYIDAIALTQDDYTPPAPAAGFAVAPVAVSGTAISMTSVTGIDDAPPVEYYFTETTGNPGGDDSGWQTSPVYTDSGLDPLTLYAYTVTMRDAWGNQGAASASQSVSTPVSIPLLRWDGSGSTTPVNGALNISGQIYAGAGIEASRGSSDGWFGPDSINGGGLSGADSTTATGYKLNGTTSLDVRFTNDSGPDFDLISLVFDYMAIWDSGPQKLEVWYSYGELEDPDSTLLITLDAPGHSGGAGAYDYPDFHVNLQEVLSDFTLSAGQSATFSIKGIDFTNSGVNGVVDNLAFLDTLPAAGPDLDPPMPDPASFAAAPAAISYSAISMTATIGSDASGPVEYLFTETSGNPGGTDSGWQTNPTYTDSGLDELTQYTYTVTLRDSVGNTGSASAGESATTLSSVDSVPPTPSPMTWSQVPAAGTDLLAVYEGFDYAAGGVIGGNGGIGFASDWATSKNSETAGSYLVDSTGLSFTDAFSNVLPVSGNSALRTTANGRSEANRTLSSATRNALFADGSTMWFSVLHERATSSEHSGFVIGSGTFDMATGWELKQYASGAEGFGFGSSNSQWIAAVGFDDVGSLTKNESSVDALSTRLLVGKVVWNVDGTDDVLSLYNVTDLSTEPVTPIATVSLDLQQANFDNVSIMANKDGSSFDEIRLGTSFASVMGGSDNNGSVTMSASLAADTSGVEYYFSETTGNPGGDDSGWQDSPNYTDDGLQAGTPYTYTVTARDKSANQNATVASASASVTTLGVATDVTPPTPDPASFAAVPAAISYSEIIMTATAGNDASGPVEYLFTETSGNPGGTDSGWQASAIYTDSGLSELTEYTYTVTLRDSVGNTGNASVGQSATTPAAPDITPPTPNPASFAAAPAAISDMEIVMTATVGFDASGVEYYFAETSGNPGGADSGWQPSASYTNSGLDELTEYTYTITLRDTLGNTGSVSAGQSATTQATPDFDPPMPNPASYTAAPSAVSHTEISMTATTGSDASGPVEYYFAETSGNAGGTDSGWQLSASYTDDGLSELTQYTYTVTLRDSLGNTGNASVGQSATTPAAPDLTPPTPNPASFAAAPAAISDTEITMTATVGFDASGSVEYYFTETSGNPGGTDSGWQSSPVYSDSGLSELTSYTYTVTLRDGLGNAGSASAGLSATTQETPDTDPPAPNPASFVSAPAATSDTEITMTATTGIDESGVEYLFTETSGNPGATSSGWQAGAVYTDSGLTAETLYTYTVTMRDSLGNTGSASAGLSATTQAPPDVDPPTPDPSSFAVAPVAVSDAEITMTATAGSDASGPVEYYFTETSGNAGGTDSGWQTSAVYTNSGLSELTEYTYTVTLRDSLGNTGSASSGLSTTTTAENLISNGSYESGLTGWNTWNSPAIVLDAYEGTSAAQMTDKGSLGQWIDVLPSTTYRLSAFIKISDGSQRVVLGTNGDSSAGGVSTYATTYTLVEKVFTTDFDTTQVEVYCWQPPSGGALATVDDMKLERVPGGADTTPPAAPAGLSALVGIGSVDLDWEDNSEPDWASYTVYRSTVSGSGYSAIASGLLVSDYADGSVTDHTTYYYVVTADDATGNESLQSTEVSAQPGWVSGSPDFDVAVQGSVSGALADAELNDDAYQTITEIDNGSTSALEHKWVFSVTAAELVTFYVEAHHSANAEGDAAIFAYSTDDVNYTDMITVTKTVDDDTAQYYSLPSGLSGTVYIRVLDADRTGGNLQLDSVNIDALFIVSEESTTAPGAASAPAPADGAVDVAVDADLSWADGMMSASHDVYFGTSPSPLFQGNLAGSIFDPGALLNGTTYYWAVDEVNNSGTTVGSVWSFTTVAAGWTVLSSDGFESGFGTWLDGGADARIATGFAIGTQCLAIQDNSATSESELANALDLSGYSELKIEFTYVPVSFEGSEDFFVNYSSDGGATWSLIQAFVNDVDFVDDGTRYYPEIVIDSGSYTFNSNVKLMFECDASGNGDDVYIDDIIISAK